MLKKDKMVPERLGVQIEQTRIILTLRTIMIMLLIIITVAYYEPWPS